MTVSDPLFGRVADGDVGRGSGESDFGRAVGLSVGTVAGRVAGRAPTFAGEAGIGGTVAAGLTRRSVVLAFLRSEFSVRGCGAAPVPVMPPARMLPTVDRFPAPFT
jgi:hypothetical protein